MLKYYVYWYKFQLNVACFIDNIIYEHDESVYLVCQESFGQRSGYSLLYIIYKYKTWV